MKCIKLYEKERVHQFPFIHDHLRHSIDRLKPINQFWEHPPTGNTTRIDKLYSKCFVCWVASQKVDFLSCNHGRLNKKKKKKKEIKYFFFLKKINAYAFLCLFFLLVFPKGFSHTPKKKNY